MAAKRVRVQPQAERDVDETTVYMAQERSAETAIRFYDVVQESYQSLLEIPGMGKAREVNNPRLTEIRQWPVDGFEKYLIFYRPTPVGIEVVRVLHGAQDVDFILERESGFE